MNLMNLPQSMPFVDQALAYRLERAIAARAANYAQARCAIGLSERCDVVELAGGSLVFADGAPPSPVNRAIALGMRGPVLPAELDAVDLFFRSHGAMPQVDVCPFADPSLIDGLRQRGYRLGRFQSVLICPLPGSLSNATASDVIVNRAGLDDIEVWLRTVAQGFAGLDDPPATDGAMLLPNFHSRNGVSYLAWLDGQPAGGGSMFLHDGVVELGGASTRMQFRRRGVQTALLQRRMADAHAAGCDMAMVITSPGSNSQRNIERHGLQLAYTKAVLVAE